MNFVDISYFHNRASQPETLLSKHKPNLGYLEFLPGHWQNHVVKFADTRGQLSRPAFDYHYFKGKSRKLWMPLEADRFVAGMHPDVVMVHGLIFPHQLLLLKTLLPKSTRIIVQHHADRPGKGRMKWLQRMADKYVDAYLFATRELAEPWIAEGILQAEKVHEVMEGSSVIERIDKPVARKYLGIGNEQLFLWVGRLDENKDPLTVLKAFQKYHLTNPQTRLHMAYHNAEPRIMEQINTLLKSNINFSRAVGLAGELDKSQLTYWYSASDYFLLGSHSEGSGYALIEAMSAGCVPVVTDIPSFRKITGNGVTGYLFDPGNEEALATLLEKLPRSPSSEVVQDVLARFESDLSFEAIAKGIKDVCEKVMERTL